MTTFRIVLLCWIFFLLSEEVRSRSLHDAEVARDFNDKDQYAERNLENKHFTPGRNYSCTFESNICEFLTNDPKNKAKWRIGSGGIDGTRPVVDHTFGNLTGKYLYVNFQEAKNNSVTLLGPDMSADYCINFWYYIFGANAGYLVAGIKYRGFESTYFYRSPIPSDQWEEQSICVRYVNELMGSSYKIIFIAENRSWRYGIGSIALDDIVFSTDNGYEDLSEKLPCGKKPCLNGGTCKNHNDTDFECDCGDHHYGLRCERTCRCDSEGKGICRESLNSGENRCLCNPGYGAFEEYHWLYKDVVYCKGCHCGNSIQSGNKERLFSCRFEKETGYKTCICDAPGFFERNGKCEKILVSTQTMTADINTTDISRGTNNRNLDYKSTNNRTPHHRGTNNKKSALQNYKRQDSAPQTAPHNKNQDHGRNNNNRNQDHRSNNEINVNKVAMGIFQLPKNKIRR